MPTPRETERTADAAAWKGVEQDVEKRRHVKDPFQGPFVTIVAAPFDAFLAGERSLLAEEEEREPLQREKLPRQTGDSDYAALEQEITARSHQVHLRLEILRQQLQCLTHDSLAVLDTEEQPANPVEDLPKRKSKDAAVTSSRSDGDNPTIQALLDRVTLYESGELTAKDIVKTLDVCDRCEGGQDAVCALAIMQKIRERLEYDAGVQRKMALSAFGPCLDDIAERTERDSPVNEPSNFLKECKRLIRPFFLEDFVRMKGDAQTNCKLSLDASQDVSSQAIYQDYVAPSSGSDCNRDKDDDIAFAIQSPNQERDLDSTQTNRAFCIQTIQKKRAAIYQDASLSDRNVRRDQANKRDHHRPLRPLMSGVKTCNKPSPQLKLLSNPRAWKNLSRSLLDPDVNLLQLRQVFRSEAIEHVSPATLHTSSHSTDNFAFDDDQPTTDSRISGPGMSDNPTRSLDTPIQQKRPLGITPVGSTKRQCVESLSKETTCVSYFRTLVQNSLPEENPRRAFVALVFSASLTNAASDNHSSEREAPIMVSLQSTRRENDVKIVSRRLQR